MEAALYVHRFPFPCLILVSTAFVLLLLGCEREWVDIERMQHTFGWQKQLRKNERYTRQGVSSASQARAQHCIPRHDLRTAHISRCFFRLFVSRLFSHLCLLLLQVELFPKTLHFCACIVQSYLPTATVIHGPTTRACGSRIDVGRALQRLGFRLWRIARCGPYERFEVAQVTLKTIEPMVRTVKTCSRRKTTF